MTRLRLAACFVVLVACFVAAGSAHAQQEPPPQPTPLFRAVANVVRVDTLVTERGKPVGKLTADDFELFDAGWHPLEVRVRRQGATIRARPGYTQ